MRVRLVRGVLMNKRMLAMACLACAMTLHVSAQAPDLAAMNARLRAEETNKSKIMWILHEITDVQGPRVTGSPGLRDGQNWAVGTMKSGGLSHVKVEPGTL